VSCVPKKQVGNKSQIFHRERMRTL